MNQQLNKNRNSFMFFKGFSLWHNKVKNKINFDSITTATTKTYNYKTNITLARTNNVKSVEFRINNVILNEPVMVNPGDTVSITIVKTTSTASAYIIITETLVR